MSALGGDSGPEQRLDPMRFLKFYSRNYSDCEVDTTHYALPSLATVKNWSGSVPTGFRFHIKAFQLFTAHVCPTNALPAVVKQALPPHLLQRKSIAWKEIPAEAQNLAWDRFNELLNVLEKEGKLGVVLFQFHFKLTQRAKAIVLQCRSRLQKRFTMAVEFRQREWFADESDARHPGLPGRDERLAWLTRAGLVLVLSDELEHELYATELKGNPVRMPTKRFVTNARAGVHRRRGTKRVLHNRELQHLALLTADMSCPATIVFGTAFETSPMENMKNFAKVVPTLDWKAKIKADIADEKPGILSFFAKRKTADVSNVEKKSQPSLSITDTAAPSSPSEKEHNSARPQMQREKPSPGGSSRKSNVAPAFSTLEEEEEHLIALSSSSMWRPNVPDDIGWYASSHISSRKTVCPELEWICGKQGLTQLNMLDIDSGGIDDGDFRSPPGNFDVNRPVAPSKQCNLESERKSTLSKTSIPCPIGGSFRLRVGGATVFRSPKQPKQGIGFVDVVPGYDSFRAQLDARQVCTASRSRTPRSSMRTYRTAKMEPHANVAGGSWASSSEEEGPAVQLPWCHHETKRALEGYNHTDRKVVCHHKKEVEREAKTAHDSLEARRQLARIWVGTQDKPVQQPARIYPQEQTQIEVSTAAIEPSSQVNGHSHVGCEAISRLDRLRMKLAKQVRWAKMSMKERQQIYGLAAGNVRQQKASITVASYRTPPPTLRYISAWTPPTVVAPPLPPPPFPEARSEQLVDVFKGHSKVSKHHVQHAAKKVDANVCHDSVSVNTSKAVPNWQRLLGYVPKTLAVKVDFRKVVPRINTGIRRDSTPELISKKSNLERAATKIKRRLDMWSYLEMRKKAGNAKVPLWKMPKA
eukprot:gene5516-24236_t